MTHRLKGEFCFLQAILALVLQDHGLLVDGSEAGGTAGGSRKNPATINISFNWLRLNLINIKNIILLLLLSDSPFWTW